MSEETTPAAAPAKRKSPMKLILAIVGVLAVAGGGAAAFMVMGAKEPASEHGAEETHEEEEVEHHELPEMGLVVPLEEFTVNLQDPSGDHYLQVVIELELNMEAESGGHGHGGGGGVPEPVATRMPLIRDALILLLSSMQADEVNTAEGKEALKEMVRTRVETILGPDTVNRVLFTSFLVQ